MLEVKRKSIALITLTAMLLVGTLGISSVFAPPVGENPTVMGVKPDYLFVPVAQQGPGYPFTVDIVLYNATEVWGWKAGLSWDPDLLECTGAVYGGDFATYANGSLQIPGTINNAIGQINPPYAETSSDLWVTVTEVKVLTVSFYCEKGGTTALDLIETKLVVYDSEAAGNADMYPPLLNGSVENEYPAPYSPTATFNVSEAGVVKPYYDPGATLTFDATGSTGGFDGDDYTTITDYSWDFGDVTTGSGATTTHAYANVGTYTVTLNVTAPGIGPYIDGAYVDTDTETGDVVIYVVPAGAAVDALTRKSWLGKETLTRTWGSGPDVEGSAFAPGDTVTLLGKATFAGLPVIATNVAFQVMTADPVLFASLVAVTNATGYAEENVRLPIVPTFGMWEATATVRIFEEDAMDTLPFAVGWIINILSVTGPAQVTRGTTATFTLTVENIDPSATYQTLLTAIVEDYLDVTRGSANSTEYIAPGISTYDLPVTVSGAAWPGYPAECIANAFTNWPGQGGVAYCPQKVFQFTIA